MYDKNVITFKTNSQAALFANEVKGQLSDGMWENTKPEGHWIPWCNATVKVGDRVGRNFQVIKDGYSLTSALLLECTGDRMINTAKEAISEDTGVAINCIKYGDKELKADLREIKKAMKTFAA